MITYTACRRCGGILHTTDGDTTHPNCEAKPTKAEQLAQQWLDIAEQGTDDELPPEQLARLNDLHDQIEAIDNRPPRLLDAALIYAGWGWPVFPLREIGTRCDGAQKCIDAGICQCTKKPATKNGFKDATTDIGRIRAWWKRHPKANIGLSTGHAFDVIDFDVPDGDTTLQQILIEDRAVHGWVTTASGGTHLYIKPTGRGCTTRWKVGADFRGHGGYVVSPPSWLGRRGTAWTWRHTPSPIITGVGDTYGVQ